MKKTLLALAVTGLVAGCSTPPEAPEQPKLDSTDQKVSYGMGLVLGERMGNDLPNLQMRSVQRRCSTSSLKPTISPLVKP